MSTRDTLLLRLPKIPLLLFSLAYFLLCIAAGLELFPSLHAVAVQGILLFFALTLTRHLLLLRFAVKDKTMPAVPPSDTLPRITILVPAYNEELVIESSLHSLLELDYPNMEIIVIDDGSTDDTARVVRRVAEQNRFHRILVISQSNAGKASALNTGIKHASGEYILTVDADSRLEADALLHGLAYFSDNEVGAVGGFVEVINKDRLLTAFQQLEYLVSLNFVRRALSHFGAVVIVPGPVGLFRREALASAGGYSEDAELFAEDADVTVRLLAEGWKVKGCRRMVARTEAPETVFALLRQRYRWKRGVFQAFDNNLFRLITAPSLRGSVIAGFLALESFLLEIINFGITLFFLAYFLRFGEIHLLITWYVVLGLLDFVTLIFVCKERGSIAYYFLLMIVQRFSYSYLLQAWAVLSLFDEWRASKMSWDKLDRLGRLRPGGGA